MDGLPDMRARDREGLSKIFRNFAEVETPRLDSRVYSIFSAGVADDADLLDLCGQIEPRQPPPNVLFAAVQNLLFEDPAGSPEAVALAPYYPAITGRPIPEASPWEAFRQFCLAHADRLGPSLKTGRTQTCVVHRCTAILPALASLPRIRESRGRVGLLEIGPSAGLNLRLDRYRYDYGGGVVWGRPDARPQLVCENRGDRPPPMPDVLQVVARRGLDLDPIDLADPASLRWLRALIWPEHAWRAKAMDEALVLAAEVPVEIEAGDATRDLRPRIDLLPEDAARVLFATHVLYQIPDAGRKAIHVAIAEASRDRPVDFVSMESSGRGHSNVTWFAYESGERVARTVLAHADSHGRWIAWVAD